MSEYIPCDACHVARSWSHILLPSGGELYMCGHHLAQHHDALDNAGAYIIDNRSGIGGTG